MKKLGFIVLSFLLINNVFAQECKNNFESNYFGLTICNDSNWKIEQKLPYLLIKTNDIKTFVTLYSEPYEGNETLKELLEKSFQLDKETYPNIEKIHEEELELDEVKGILYITKSSDNSNQITTFICLKDGRKLTINNNCYSGCDKALFAIKNVINNIRFQKIEEQKLNEKEFVDFETFTIKLHDAFKNKSPKSFEKLLINKALMLKLFETKLKDETMKKRYTEIVSNNWEEFSKEFTAKSKTSFKNLISEGEKLGINWQKIELLAIEYELASTIPGITSAVCTYKFSYNGKNYKIDIDSVEPLKEGWFISKLDTSSISEY